jgi:hypothetical protein
MAEHASDFIPGEMDIHQQASTFHHFIRFSKWGSLAIAVLVLTATIWFCTNGGFLGGAAAGVIVLIAGILLLREKHPGRPAH